MNLWQRRQAIPKTCTLALRRRCPDLFPTSFPGVKTSRDGFLN